MQAYNAYWNNYMKGDVETMQLLLDEEYTQVGSAEGEVFFNKKDAVQFLYDTIHQVAGKLEMRNRSTKLDYQDNIVLVHELCDLYALTDGEWIFYSKFRASTLMQEKEQDWKIIQDIARSLGRERGFTFGSPAEIGRLFLTDHLLAFEITSIVLLVAAVGGVVLGMKSAAEDDAL